MGFGNKITTFIATILLTIPSLSQNVRKDTINAAFVIAHKSDLSGTLSIDHPTIAGVIGPLGDDSIIKFLHTLPGVSTGAEGSSAMYVRGGNLGGNLITIDGIPIYGSGHILGFSTAYSQDIAADTKFLVGGFTSDEGNLTSSHIKVTTKNGNFDHWSGSTSISPFIAGGSFSFPIIKEKISFIGCARISPIGKELSMIKPFSAVMDSISAIKTNVYDAFGKISWRLSKKQQLSLTGFTSLDSYGYQNGLLSKEEFNWSNLIVSLNHTLKLSDLFRLENGLSLNSFQNYQSMTEILGTDTTALAIKNNLKEKSLKTTILFDSFKGWNFQGGLKLRFSEFSPASEINSSNTIKGKLFSEHLQVSKSKNNLYDIRVSGRVNQFYSKGSYHWLNKLWKDFEISASGRLYVTGNIGFEATADKINQYYHTIEGIPIGWSMDMIIPTDRDIKPEKAIQYYSGFFLFNKRQRLSVGAYKKSMDNLLYFADATLVFNADAVKWRDNICSGRGSSKGFEIQYGANFNRISGKVTYTWSKTDRCFKELNDGIPFPSKFDRTHILNMNAEYSFFKLKNQELSISSFFTYQSGHWETVPAGEYSARLPFDKEITVSYNSTLNNWRTPAYIRLDFGMMWKYGIGSKYPGTVNVGIYNILNRHNTYSITYDAALRKWRQLSLFPIMPTISWTMNFL